MSTYHLDPEVMRWVSIFATCAIEGNETAQEMIDLWNNGCEDVFVQRLKDEWLDEE